MAFRLSCVVEAMPCFCPQVNMRIWTPVFRHTERQMTDTVKSRTQTILLLLIVRTNFSEFSDDWHNR